MRKYRDNVYDEKLIERRMCGKRGTPQDLASALQVDSAVLTRILRRMRDDGHPITVEPHPIDGVIYSYEKPKRTCKKLGCHTKLSRYNSGGYCALHQPAEDLPLHWFLMPNRRTS